MKTLYSITEAAKIVGVARPTFYDHVKLKNITLIGADTKRPKVEASELIRVYEGERDLDFESVNRRKSVSRDEGITEDLSEFTKTDTPRSVGLEAGLIREQLERERSLFEERIEQYENQLDHMKEILAKAQEGQNRLTLLLEDKRENDKSGDDKFKSVVEALEKRIGDNEKENKEALQKVIDENNKRLDEEKKQNDLLKEKLEEETRKLEEERNKGFFKKLFG